MGESAECAEENNRETLFPRWLRYTYVTANGTASVVAFGAGIISGNIAIAEAGLQGTAEIGITGIQMKDAHRQDHVDDERRRRIYSAITSLSLIGAGVATGEAMGAWDVGVNMANIDALGLGAAVVAMSTGVLAAGTIGKRVKSKYGSLFKRQNRERVNTPEYDAIRHIVNKDLPISVLATLSGIARIYQQTKWGEDWGGYTENVLGITSGIWGAYLFWPSKNNLEHGHDSDRELLPEAIEKLEQIGHQEFDTQTD